MNVRRPVSLLTVVVVCFAFVTGETLAIQMAPDELAGKRLFVDGIGSHGVAVIAQVGAQSTPVPASVSPCANCHGADGKGRPEGGIQPPDITWRELEKPYGHAHDNGRTHSPFDQESFARAVVAGVDPAGNRMDPAMPRYVLSDVDARNLVAYLKRIDQDHDPGIEPDTLTLGTVLPQRGPLAGSGVEAVVGALIEEANAKGGIHGRKLRLKVVDAMSKNSADGAVRELKEVLSGDDVFAFVAPMVPGLANEFAGLAESAAVPVVGALTPDGGYEEAGRYLFQPLPGGFEQARALAEFAVREFGPSLQSVAIVHSDSPRDTALAEGAEAQFRQRGWTRIAMHSYSVPWHAGEIVAGIHEAGAQHVLFFGHEREFSALTAAILASSWSPTLLTPAGHAGRISVTVPPQYFGRIFLAFPWTPDDLSRAGARAVSALRRDKGVPARAIGLQAAAYAATQVMIEGLKRSGRALSRVKFVDSLENLYGFETGVLPPISFGPARRVGVQGAHVVNVDPITRVIQPGGRYIALEPMTP